MGLAQYSAVGLVKGSRIRKAYGGAIVTRGSIIWNPWPRGRGFTDEFVWTETYERLKPLVQP